MKFKKNVFLILTALFFLLFLQIALVLLIILDQIPSIYIIFSLILMIVLDMIFLFVLLRFYRNSRLSENLDFDSQEKKIKLDKMLESSSKGINQTKTFQTVRDLNEKLVKLEQLSMKFEIFAQDINSSSLFLSQDFNAHAHEMGEINQQIKSFDKQLQTTKHHLKELASASAQNKIELANLQKSSDNSLSKISDMMELVDEGMANMRDSRQVLDQTKQSIERSEQNKLDLRKSLLQMDRELQDITSIVGSIEEISERTHILATNASILAARAGEAGSGFSVVAGEVRKLAAKSANQVARANSLIDEIKKLSQETARRLDRQDQETQGLQQLVSGTHRVFDQLAASVNSIAGFTDDFKQLQNQEAESRVKIIAQQENNHQQLEETCQLMDDGQQNYQQIYQKIEKAGLDSERNSLTLKTLSQLGISLNLASKQLKQFLAYFSLKFEDHVPECRKEKRLPSLYHIKIHDSQNKQLIGFIDDISRSGMRLLSQHKVSPKDSLFQLNFSSVDYKDQDRIYPVEVLWSRYEEDLDLYSSGCRFKNLNPDCQKALESYLRLCSRNLSPDSDILEKTEASEIEEIEELEDLN